MIPTHRQWLRRLALAGVVLGLAVVVFGAYVRLTYAGLGCPDWPGCFGHITPSGAQAANAGTADVPLEVGKAWREMIHRYAASTLGLLIVVLLGLAWWWRKERGAPRGLPRVLLALVLFQGLLGALTVTWKVKPVVVTSHLVFGLTTVSLLWWLWLSLRRVPQLTSGALAPRELRLYGWARRAAVLGLLALIVQIVLGGWTSTNYAAVGCPDFPTCQQQWWPQADFREGFVLWRGLGTNYEGGVLDYPARIAIHLTHRLGAIVATTALLLAAVLALRCRFSRAAGRAGLAVVAALLLQLCIGIFMVWQGFPLSLATAHNAGAALLLLATLALNHTLRALPTTTGLSAAGPTPIGG
jgi:cytochrome c oxidase assembly protein subunit 15